MQFLPLTDTPPSIQSAVRTLRNQEAVRRFMYTAHEISPTEHQQWLESLKDNPRQAVFVAIHEGVLAGVVSLNAINTTHKTADWAFYLDAQLRGKGLGSLVEFWLLDHAFNDVGLEKLNCEVLEMNTAVIKMHQKFGFQLEGVRRNNIIKEGHRVNVVLLGITKAEWLAHRPALLPLITRLSGSERSSPCL
ncbi:UDP-4-amino-4,6-dideoxy-N-acetyl-beta-L-altrosamine N-acetyltransferase [Pseudomonas sp. GD03842]|uniref:UDP-4-amino-4, 6-dideoxy-N-acetyl-beta-L-altrosamine N-acetyltransferase n=1 Tax=Pseudomonas sp. GD03842 TaxID=2975385 RepID=UPI00244D0662|nr:UDP-4-amino-4,6-dideoxy-N-acetyl-beta-L-altrosamine N-acetyltransferase [Pseudomonas sp. GD03842]MDH0748715.1 UDP-4-amino-4,6-dideoxy-N-acetyl-beta-L-altrosamine N-acetyltransferase [Pseudomonas sp. GD03842]